MALTVSCGLAAALYAAEIPADQLEGRWASEAGTSLTFRADHTFTSQHFDKLPVASLCNDPSAMSSGRWAFYGPAGTGKNYTADEAVTHGSVLSLTFSVGDCTVGAYLFGDEDDPVLCPTDDPDDGCPSKGYLRRTNQAEKRVPDHEHVHP
uniref:hypothetical protein n=1 Tax=Streptomyces sp. SAT1 TaxID=1849967 RepID=UPI0007F9CE2D|nr:hypothetical protein [Streptomyces sp. SAT1]ANO41941.1 hypothetical protein A8713_032265 [Streptomyces sp. SAT1]